MVVDNNNYFYPRCRKYSSEDTKRKWKNLRDRFMRIVASKKLSSSGAASSGTKKQWRFYQSLQFLRDTFLRKEYKSNMSTPAFSKMYFTYQNNCYCYFKTASNMSVSDDNNNEKINIKVLNKDADKINRKKKAMQTFTQDNILKQISEKLRQFTLTLPTPLIADEIHNFLMTISAQLHTLPDIRKRRMMFQIHEMLYNELLQ
ncbi:hypothetical protein G5I_13910 [Acromyrmex echinatior]|uniref:MADF domain-containing protein n=1 Tax=Acromyrmex echinatior TaxID=103372 RepID=F4X687_ACREC|nr:hypothetical protein G5I_13910 [Acromyrmex echinatior]